MDRRGFLRMLGMGAATIASAPIIKPKGFFSFYGTGEVWKPEPLWVPSDKVILGFDLGADGYGVWTARLGKWCSGPIELGTSIVLPDGSTLGADARGGMISTTRYTANSPSTITLVTA